MPITVTAPRGVLTESGETEILPRLTDALVEAHGMTGNAFFKSIVGGTVHILDPRDIYAGGETAPVVAVELKLPSIGLPDLETRKSFIESASEIVAELTVEAHDSFHTWVNVVNAPDGAWGFGGRSWTNEALLEAAASAATTTATTTG
jgi:phenylpyruvate tautomerase PptA (4-oxalocrotonate tautomerase family)